MSLLVFGNMFIDNEERLLRLCDSVGSLSTLKADGWVLNLRGRFAGKAHSLLKDRVAAPIYFSFIDGIWNKVSLKLLEGYNAAYTLLILEDHICVGGTSLVFNAVREMQAHSCDIMNYSFFNFGSYTNRYSKVMKYNGIYLDFFCHNSDNNKIVQSTSGGSYLVALCSVFKTTFLKRILEIERVCQWSPVTPFPFEVPGDFEDILPLRRAIPKYELFCCIDDSGSVGGGSLQERGMYPLRQGKISYARSSAGLIDFRVS